MFQASRSFDFWDLWRPGTFWRILAGQIERLGPSRSGEICEVLGLQAESQRAVVHISPRRSYLIRWQNRERARTNPS